MLINVKICILFAIIATVCYKEVLSISYKDRIIGCLFSDVCADSEVCFDDNAFGRCEQYDGRKGSFSSEYVYQLDRKTLQLLEKELDRLSEQGYTWTDTYSQCILKTILNDRPRIVYDPSSCDQQHTPSTVTGEAELIPSPLPTTKHTESRHDNENIQNLNGGPIDYYEKQSTPVPVTNSLVHQSDVLRPEKNLVNQEQTTFDEDVNPIGGQSLLSKLHNSLIGDNVDSEQDAQMQKQKTINNSKSRTMKMSDDFIKSSLREKHWKRKSFDNSETSNSGGALMSDSGLDERNNDQLIQSLLDRLATDYDSTMVDQKTDNNDYDDVGAASAAGDLESEANTKDMANYLQFMLNNNIPYFKNAITSDKYLDANSPRNLDDKFDDSYSDSVVDNKYNALFSKIHQNQYQTPEIRVLRDIDEYIDDGSDVNLPLESNDDKHLNARGELYLVDLDSEPTKDYNNELDVDDNKPTLLADIFNDVLIETNNENKIKDDNDDLDLLDSDDNEKELVFDDVNYNNNYDSQRPNFYREHRYDIKKPGPKYFEEYFVSSNDNNNEDNEESEDSLQQPQLISKKQEDFDSQLMVKKEISIRSNKPVSEGPVKVEGKSEDTLIIRSAEMGEDTSLEAIDSTHTYVITDKMLGEEESQKFVQTLEQIFKLPRGTFSNLRKEDFQITFKVNPNYLELNASLVASKIEDYAKLIHDMTGYEVKETGIGNKTKLPVVSAAVMRKSNEKLINLTIMICSLVLATIGTAFVIFLYRRNANFREKIKGLMKMSEELRKFDYQELCRQRMQKKSKDKSEDKESLNKKVDGKGEECKPKNIDTAVASQQSQDMQTSPQSRSSTSSWVEEPVSSNMDITTGHIILSYMEDHLKKRDRLNQEWEALCAYEADPCSTNAALQKQNSNKNRCPDVLPYDHSRVILNDFANVNNSDYINANTITDHDPRNPAYIVTQGPLANTSADFWQMIWEQGSMIIVMLTRLRENGLSMCDRYWPEEGSEIYQNYEVHLVSEHIWCDDYLVRSFYLKNLKSGETRTVTQFHFLSWPENGIPPNTKSILDFRRKINKSYKGRSCPIVVHCSNGTSRSGTYILIDMVLNRLSKGAKEIDIAATLEHIRDQRMGMVNNKAQFEFVLLAVTEEVQAILKALPQN